MANPKHVEVVRLGSQAIADWRRENQGELLDLTAANLSGLNLSDAYLRNALLTNANLRGANLSGADLVGATLIRTVLAGAILRDANFAGATFYEADLSGAMLPKGVALPTVDEVHPTNLVRDLERTITAALLRAYPADWIEDLITHEILQALRDTFQKVRLSHLRQRKTIQWTPFKLRGTAEHIFGDLAVLVRFGDVDGVELEGVGFLEAKKRYPNSGSYEQLDPAQVNRILQHAPHGMLLLYDYLPVDDFTRYQISAGYYLRSRELASANVLAIHVVEEVHPFSGIFTTRTVSVPLAIAQALALRQQGLQRFSLPLAHQLALRYLNGLDLEFGASPLAIAKGWMANLVGAPRYILVIEVVGDGSGKHWNPGINLDLYRQLGEE